LRDDQKWAEVEKMEKHRLTGQKLTNITKRLAAAAGEGRKREREAAAEAAAAAAAAEQREIDMTSADDYESIINIYEKSVKPAFLEYFGKKKGLEGLYLINEYIGKANIGARAEISDKDFNYWTGKLILGWMMMFVLKNSVDTDARKHAAGETIFPDTRLRNFASAFDTGDAELTANEFEKYYTLPGLDKDVVAPYLKIWQENPHKVRVLFSGPRSEGALGPRAAARAAARRR
tara:strand:- start:1075 stop:1773 length:699 start_codon:yes stop_codon:yes gene_type:complete